MHARGRWLEIALCLGCLTGASAAQSCQAQPQRIARAEPRASATTPASTAPSHSQAAPTPPAILSGTLQNTAINVARAPASPKATLQFSATNGGLNSIALTFTTGIAPQTVVLTYAPPDEGGPPFTAGTIAIVSPFAFNLYAAPGTWTLTAATIHDNNGGRTVYDAAELAYLFPSVNLVITNKLAPDTLAPAALSGKLLTPTISLKSANPYFGAQLTVSDNLSGVALVSVFLQPPGTTATLDTNTPPPAPILHGAVNTYLSMAYQPIGIWTIAGYLLCDAARNCLTVTSPTAIATLFGTTTFEVTD